MTISPLLAAVEAGDAPRVAQLLANGTDPDVVALKRAVETRHAPCCRALLDAGAPPSAGLFKAVATNAPDIVQMLLDAGAWPNQPNPSGWTPLFFASTKGLVEPARLLLRAGASPSARHKGKNSLHAACQHGHVAVAQALLQAGANVDAKVDGTGQTPLQLAALHGHWAVVEALLAADASLAARADLTALHWGASQGHARVVETLLRAGADANQRTRAGAAAPLHLAVRGVRATTWRTGALRTVEALLAGGADVHAVDGDHNTPLLIAARTAGQPGVVRALLRAGASASATDKLLRNTPLHAAARSGGLANVEALLAAGAPVSAKASYLDRERTALHCAASGGWVDVMLSLLAAGAELDQRVLEDALTAPEQQRGLAVDVLLQRGQSSDHPFVVKRARRLQRLAWRRVWAIVVLRGATPFVPRHLVGRVGEFL